MKEWVTATELASTRTVTTRAIRKRAVCEAWESRKRAVRGGLRLEYRVATLPDDLRSTLEIVYEAKPEQDQAATSRMAEYNRERHDARIWILSHLHSVEGPLSKFVKAWNSGEIEAPRKVRDLYPVLSKPTIDRWKRARRQGITLATNYGARRGHASELSEEAKSVLLALYLNQNQLSVSKCFSETEKVLGPLGVSEDTVRRFLCEDISESARVFYRLGGDKWNAKMAPSILRNYYLYQPNQWWVIDHHMIDAGVNENGKILRPWITAISDLRSRRIMGWAISFNPCTFTILEALKMAIIENGYRAPKGLMLDNGKDMKSYTLTGRRVWVSKEVAGVTEAEEVHLFGVLEQLYIKAHYCWPYHGQSKPIERWFRTLIEDKVKLYPSYLGSNTATRPDDQKRFWKPLGGRRRLLVFTIDAMREDLSKYIREWNATWHHSGHGMEGRTPEEVWNIDPYDGPQILPAALDLITSTDTDVRSVGKNGITIDNIEYYAPELAQYKGRGKVVVRRLFDDASRILVYTTDNRRFICEATADVLRETGAGREDVAMIQKRRKVEREVVRVYAAQIAEGKERLSVAERVAALALSRQPEYEDPLLMRKVSGNPLMVGKPEKLKLKTGFSSIDDR